MTLCCRQRFGISRGCRHGCGYGKLDIYDIGVHSYWNWHLAFAYNSAYLAFAAIFSFRWLGGQSLHTTTGFIAAIMCLYAFHGLKEFKQHERHVADMMRIGILFYALVMLCGSMSPATDYAAMFFSLYVITAWCENLESGKSLDTYSLLSVAAVFVATLKFSACFLALIVVYPAVFLVKGKRWKEIARYIASGFVIVVPFLVRNYLISGWLLYPFNGIDIFHVRWKIPEEYLLVDAEQIKVWGRGLYDIGKIDWPVRRWLPIWWEELERYEKMLLGAFLAGTVLLMVLYAKRIFRRGKIEWDLAAALLAVYSSMALWFVMAPFIRYGLAFIFTVPMVALGEYLGEKKKGLYSIVAGSLVFCIIVSISPYWDHYITDAGVFIKQNLKKPYYLMQKDYDDGEEAACEINGNVIYYSVGGEVNTYHVCPSTCYEFMLERSTLMGEELKDGFMAK